MRRPRPQTATGAIALVLPVITLVTSGCQGVRLRAPTGNTTPTTLPSQTTASTTPDTLRAQAMAAADTYLVFFVQGCDKALLESKRPEVVQWAMRQRVATSLACLANATNANQTFALLDMLVLATLKRASIEEYWVPTLLREDGADVLQQCKIAEAQVWGIAGKVLTPAQLDETRSLIEQWQKEHPRQYYISHVRFSDFTVVQAMNAQKSSQIKLPNSIFSLLYIDPLAGLDPVAREIRGYRDLTERLVYLSTRMTGVLQWQMQLTIYDTLLRPEVKRVTDSAAALAESSTKMAQTGEKFAVTGQQFTEATSRFVDAVAKYPADFSVERKEAIDQLMAGVTEQRQQAIKEIEGQEAKLRALIGETKDVLARAESAGQAINASTVQTVTTTEAATRRMMTLAFWLALILIVVLLLGVPISMLLYKRFRKHPDASPASGGRSN